MIATILLAAALTNVTGVVTFERETLPFVFLTDDQGTHWRVAMESGDKVRVKVGDCISAEGEPEASIKRRLTARRLTVSSNDPAKLPVPRVATITEIFKEVMPYGGTPWYGSVIVTEGLVRDINRRQMTTQLLVGEGDYNLQVEVPWVLEEALPSELIQGATVRVTGNLAYTSIENLEEGVFGRAENIELIPVSGKNIEVVKRAPFWTAERLMLVLGGIGVFTLIILAWAVTLRRMVAKRTRELGESIRERETERIEADAARRERLRLAADLHDGFQQYLAGAMFRLKAAINYLPKEAEKSRDQLAKVQDALQHTQNGLRTTLWAMNEESEGPESLMDLFRFTARRMGHWDGVVDIAAEGEEKKVARKSAGTLLLIMQEAVGNALKHGKAQHVRVRLSFNEKWLNMSIIDDGQGFAPEFANRPVGAGSTSGESKTTTNSPSLANFGTISLNTSALSKAGHYGMASMERRTNELGGKLEVWSKGGLGTKLVFTIPYTVA